MARQATRPLDRFLHDQAASGVLLLLAAAVALGLANSPWAEAYRAAWQAPVTVGIGDLSFTRSLEWVVNDGLMTIFFFVVGLEIRREIYQGELSQWRRAALPVAAALGGMVTPALIFLAIAQDPALRPGWGIPMATDIAFALGVLALLGTRAPPALRVLLLALAVIDDLGAILVIAIFYSAGFEPIGLLVAGLGLGGIYLLRGFGVRRKLVYCLPGVVIWAGTYASGIHPTIAGVIIGLVTPVQVWMGVGGLTASLDEHLSTLTEGPTTTGEELSATLQAIDIARREALSPAESLIESLHPWVTYGIMPLFALANAGVSLGEISLTGPTRWLSLGVVGGLLLGKPLGVALLGELALRTGLATLPRGLNRRHLLVLGLVAGIGFTMSLFVAQLAFLDAKHLGPAKLGVLVASLLAGIAALVVGRLLLPSQASADAATSADEAERSTQS